MLKKSADAMPHRYEREWAGASRYGSILALTHPTAVILFGLMALVLALCAARGIPSLRPLVLLPIAMMWGQAAIGIFNEVYDYDLDGAAKPWRALPAGLISCRAAVAWGVGCALLGFLCALLIAVPSAPVYALGIGIGILYSARLKNTVFSGVPYLIAYPLLPIWVWVSLDKFQLSLLAIYPLALPLALAVHLVNQLRDFDDDQRLGLHSLVQVLGKARATALCVLLLLASPLTLWLPGVWLQSVPALAAVCLCSLFYWGVMGSFLAAHWGETSAEVFRGLFKRLQLTGPLLLICAFLLLGA